MGKPGWPLRPLAAERRCDTGGSETSQYPEEKKSTEIPLVAASERGGAQTSVVSKPVGVATLGLWDTAGRGHGLAGELQIPPLAEPPGKVGRRG